MSASAPKGLRPEEVGALVAELDPLLVDARVEKVFDPAPHTLLLRLRSPAGRRHLLLSTRPGLARFHLVEDVDALPSRPGETASELRSLLTGARCVSVDQPGADRVVRIRLEWGRRGSPTAGVDLILEMFGRAGRIVLVDAESRRARFVHGRGGLAVGERYRFPDPPARTDGDGETWTVPFEPRSLVPEEQRDHETPFHRFLELRMREEESREDRRQRRREVTTRLNREAKRRRRLVQNLERDIESASSWERWQREGELLKGQLHDVRRGLASIEVTDWYDPDTPTISISLDPTLGPQENVARIFRRARRGKRTLGPLRERHEGAAGELAAIDELRAAIADADPEDLAAEDAALAAAGSWLAEHERRRPERTGSRERAAPRRSGPRRFVSREGLPILAGRNARENDELSVRSARGNDLFFHRADQPGPHVILRLPKGHNASPESIDDAAYVAAYLSGWRGPGAAIVHWTEAKNVRKPKGAPPGRVQVHRVRDHQVAYDADRIATLSESRGGTDGPEGPKGSGKSAR